MVTTALNLIAIGTAAALVATMLLIICQASDETVGEVIRSVIGITRTMWSMSALIAIVMALLATVAGWLLGGKYSPGQSAAWGVVGFNGLAITSACVAAGFKGTRYQIVFVPIREVRS